MRRITAEHLRAEVRTRTDRRLEEAVRRIVEEVRRGGDAALMRLTRKFDGVRLRSPRIPPSAWRASDAALSPAQRAALEEAASRIRRFHRRQMPKGFVLKEAGCAVSFRYVPVARAGVYIPAGQAPLVSSVLMTVVPAQVAGVGQIAVCSPPSAGGTVHPAILACLRMLGVSEAYCAGGAQAVAALAFGTQTIPACEVVCGPGNRFVDMAKRIVSGEVGIDLPAGPSEVAVFADDTADPGLVAADLAAQAEHTAGAAYLITTSKTLADEVERRGGTGTVVLVRSRQEALVAVNAIAPEHLQILCRNPSAIADRAVAGAVFVGPYTPAALGDYFAGPSHILPTGRTARFSSGLSVATFLRSYAVIEADERFLRRHGGKIAEIARLEGLLRHARSVEMRLHGKGHRSGSSHRHAERIQ